MRSKKASYIMYYIDVEHKYTTKNSYRVEVHSANPGSIILKWTTFEAEFHSEHYHQNLL